MITSSYDLDTAEEAFDVALKIDLTFKRLINVMARCSKCEGYEHYNYQCPSKSRHDRLYLVTILTNRRLLRMPTFLLRLLV